MEAKGLGIVVKPTIFAPDYNHKVFTAFIRQTIDEITTSEHFAPDGFLCDVGVIVESVRGCHDAAKFATYENGRLTDCIGFCTDRITESYHNVKLAVDYGVRVSRVFGC